MDMVLYSLLKNKISEVPKDKVNNVDGNKIEFVDTLPNPLEENTLYFVLGEYNAKDKINVGGRGVQCIVYNGNYIDYGILNGNQFFNGYDFNRGIVRSERVVSTDGDTIICENTVAENINYMMIKGQTKLDDNGLIVGANSYLSTLFFSKDGSVNSDEEYYININKYFNALANGMMDTLDMTTGVYTQALTTEEINGNLTWEYKGIYGDYMEFKIKNYGNTKPLYLNYYMLYNTEELMELTEENAFIFNSDFVIASLSNRNDKNCIYVYNGSLYLRIHKDLVNNSTSYALNLKTYLTSNPIKFSVGRLFPKQETILSITDKIHRHGGLKAMDGATYIISNVQNSFPIIEVEFPVLKGKPTRPTSISDVNEEEVIEEEPTIMSLDLDEELIVEIVEPIEEVVYEYETVVLDGNLNWQNSAPLGDCREFKCVGFDEKPIYLTEDGLYDESIFMPFNEKNVTVLDVDSDFTINSKAEPHGECIFVHNGVLYIHICSSSVKTGKGMTYAKSLKQYLTDNPITLKIRKI